MSRTIAFVFVILEIARHLLHLVNASEHSLTQPDHKRDCETLIWNRKTAFNGDRKIC